ncbi:MAG: conjugal transfer protein TrbL [Atopobiaceae bacterium]|nr:conjugal transfer protein TrbL [Atopobiaceae bacterium]
MFNSQVDMLKGIGVEGVLSAGFAQMLGSAGSVTMYDIVHGVWEVAVLPIGCGILGFVFTVQLIKISQRMDGNASMPGVKEVVFLLVFFAVFLFLVQNSFELMRAVYEVTRLAISRVSGMFGAGGALDLSAVSITTEDDDVAALLAMLVVALVSWLVVIVAYVVALVVSWARAIQIYVMAAFSPIPLALMSLDETRQMGVGYLKNFAAVCLAGIIILVLLVSFPVVLGGLDAASAGVPVVDSVVGGLSYALQYLAMCILLILSLVKSGSWARDIMGG